MGGGGWGGDRDGDSDGRYCDGDGANDGMTVRFGMRIRMGMVFSTNRECSGDGDGDGGDCNVDDGDGHE